MMLSETLAELARLLNEGSLNYAVFLLARAVPLRGDGPSEALVRAALGHAAVVGGIQDVSREEMLEEVGAAISHVGDRGSGPAAGVVASARFHALLAAALADLDARARVATKVESFWLKKGHPAYPVFWDFAFLVTGSAEALVFIGSSSD